jgi:hypothetical protein
MMLNLHPLMSCFKRNWWSKFHFKDFFLKKVYAFFGIKEVLEKYENNYKNHNIFFRLNYVISY